MGEPLAPGSEGATLLRAGDRFYWAHGLGNDYLIVEQAGPDGRKGWDVRPSTIRRICRRGWGVGADGLLILAGREPSDGVFAVRGFNPDGSEFERSGNGLRVLASYLFREGLVDAGPFEVRTGGTTVAMTVESGDSQGHWDVSLEMGRAHLGMGAVSGDPGQLDPDGRAVHPVLGPVEFIPVSVGNPHAVVFSSPTPEAIGEIGPFLSRHAAFPNGMNVQLVEVEGHRRLRIGIWERGVGPTSASGTSSCAAAVAAVSTGRMDPGPTSVEMGGGKLTVTVSEDLDVTLRGPVEEIAEGRLAAGFLD